MPSGVEKQHQKLQVEPRRGPGGSKLTLKCSPQLQSGAQELPSGAQELPSGTQELQNGAQEQPRSAQEPPSWVQEAHKKLQVEPKETPKRPQEKNKRRPTSSKGSLERQECKNMRFKLSCRRELDFEGLRDDENQSKFTFPSTFEAVGSWIRSKIAFQDALEGYLQ